MELSPLRESKDNSFDFVGDFGLKATRWPCFTIFSCELYLVGFLFVDGSLNLLCHFIGNLL